MNTTKNLSMRYSAIITAWRNVCDHIVAPSDIKIMLATIENMPTCPTCGADKNTAHNVDCFVAKLVSALEASKQ